MNAPLVFKRNVVLCQWGSKTQNIGFKQIDKDQITTALRKIIIKQSPFYF